MQMVMSIEALRSEIRDENRKFALQAVVAMVLAFGVGFAGANYVEHGSVPALPPAAAFVPVTPPAQLVILVVPGPSSPAGP